MNKDIPVRFYKLKNGENLVAFEVKDERDHYTISRPLSFTVDNEVGGGRQMLNVKEWLPPIVCSSDSVMLLKEFVMFSTAVKESFKEEFDYASEYLYSVEAVKKSRRTQSPTDPIPVMLRDPSTKPN